ELIAYGALSTSQRHALPRSSGYKYTRFCRACTLWDARSVPMPVAPRIPDVGTAHSAIPVWPPTGTQQARKPAGGFIDCPVDYLTLPWWVYQQGAMGFD